MQGKKTPRLRYSQHLLIFFFRMVPEDMTCHRYVCESVRERNIRNQTINRVDVPQSHLPGLTLQIFPKVNHRFYCIHRHCLFCRDQRQSLWEK